MKIPQERAEIAINLTILVRLPMKVFCFFVNGITQNMFYVDFYFLTIKKYNIKHIFMKLIKLHLLNSILK